MSDDGASTTIANSRSPRPHSSDEVTPTSTIMERKEDPPKEIASEENGKREATHEDPDFPDGGWRAWLVVFGAMCNTFSTFGFVNSWGTFQAYYQQNTLRDSPPSNIAWIGSIQYSLIFLPAVFVGRLFDLGHFRSIFLTSSAVLIASTFLIAQCTEYWQFLLCQGFAAGLACGGIFGPTTAVISHWFRRRRGLAMGIVAVGSSIGGTIIPITAHKLIPLVGFQWAIRTVGFILLLVLGMANLTLRRRLPPINSPGGLLNLKAFKSAPFTFYCLSAFVIFLGLYTVLTYVGISALVLGIPPDLSFYLIAIANASSLFGRYTSGAISDRVGPMNVMIPFTAAAGILTYAWPFARSQGSLIAVVVLYGFSSGSYVSLLSNPMMALGETDDVGRRLGMFMSIFSLGALAGPPISGAINKASGGFEVVGYYAGSMVMVGVALMCITRHLVLRRIIGKF
ncbi:MFS general substrate transporter [Collybia nuda]|uniref:MFS general substrate transporter n=1 Tax=Collybia nuda TaxID=64659 RepID=A0A9P6CDJ7_9AGAR|nr:MFS general substrate transporter [Collybia nuda]